MDQICRKLSPEFSVRLHLLPINWIWRKSTISSISLNNWADNFCCFKFCRGGKKMCQSTLASYLDMCVLHPLFIYQVNQETWSWDEPIFHHAAFCLYFHDLIYTENMNYLIVTLYILSQLHILLSLSLYLANLQD